MSLPASVDVAIVGAGTAGAAAALLCARRGLRVLAIDRAPLERAGAHWINAVPTRLFDEAGIARPIAPELESPPVAMHMLAGRGPVRATSSGQDLLEVDMAHLVARLQRDAREAGAILEGGVRALGVDHQVGGAAQLRTDRGPVRADAIVDASGLAGARLLGDLRTPRTDLCAAAQEVRVLRDRGEAERFFASLGVPLGDVVVMAGLAGGYSILNVRVARDRVFLLSGTIPGEGHPSGQQLIDGFCAEQRWIGELVHGGSRAIPLGRPADVLARDRVALLGDSARQVFSAHGSGIGAGLVAARVLADELAGGRGVHGYGVRWQRAHGGLLAGYDVFRRFSQRLSVDDLARMIEAGLVDARTMTPAMEQRAPELSVGALLPKARRALREPRLLAGIARVGARMAALEALYRAYPARVGSRRAWVRAVERVASIG